MANSVSADISRTVTQVVTFLTRPLHGAYSATRIHRLQEILEENLTALVAPLWVMGGNPGYYSLNFSPHCLPSRSIYSACVTAGVQWFEWITLLGGHGFDLFIQPGCVTIHCSDDNTRQQTVVLWSEDSQDNRFAHRQSAAPSLLHNSLLHDSNPGIACSKGPKTLAQQLLENDFEDEEQLFSTLAKELGTSVWTTPLNSMYPVLPRSESPLSAVSVPSRSSSRSSNSSRGFPSSGFDTRHLMVSPMKEKEPKRSCHRKARSRGVFVDTSRTDVTPYDGGKTTVLTGGVMLGSGPGLRK